MQDLESARRVVIFCGACRRTSAFEHIEAIADAFPRWDLIVIQEVPGRRGWLPGALRRWAREPISYPMQHLSALAARLGRPRHQAPGPSLPAESPNGIDRSNVRYVAVLELHGQASLEMVGELRPWLGISIDTPILNRALFNLPRRGTINIRKCLQPGYRGMAPGFGELRDGIETTGVVVHWIDDDLNAGPIVWQRPLAIPPFSTPAGLAAELDLLGTDALIEALRQIDAGAELDLPREVSNGPTKIRPTWRLERAVNASRWRRRAPAGGLRRRLTRAGKAAVLALYVGMYCRMRNALRGLAGRCHVTVLLYHRVSDEFLDSVTVGVEQFDRHLHCLRRHYDVIDLPTFLATRGSPRRRPCVVLTFDDGYEDNLLAALLLRRAGLPCTFFICTRIVGTDRAFPHDLQRLSRRVPALDWDQVHRMVSWGFQMGNHTAHHANLGTIPVGQAIDEVLKGCEDLRDRLGDCAGADWLAYPYGKPEDITDELRARLPGLGVPYCFSAYGGTNPPDFDPLNILRQSIDHGFTELRLRAAVEGWKWRS